MQSAMNPYMAQHTVHGDKAGQTGQTHHALSALHLHKELCLDMQAAQAHLAELDSIKAMLLERKHGAQAVLAGSLVTGLRQHTEPLDACRRRVLTLLKSAEGLAAGLAQSQNSKLGLQQDHSQQARQKQVVQAIRSELSVSLPRVPSVQDLTHQAFHALLHTPHTQLASAQPTPTGSTKLPAVAVANEGSGCKVADTAAVQDTHVQQQLQVLQEQLQAVTQQLQLLKSDGRGAGGGDPVCQDTTSTKAAPDAQVIKPVTAAQPPVPLPHMPCPTSWSHLDDPVQWIRDTLGLPALEPHPPVAEWVDVQAEGGSPRAARGEKVPSSWEVRLRDTYRRTLQQMRERYEAQRAKLQQEQQQEMQQQAAGHTSALTSLQQQLDVNSTALAEAHARLQSVEGPGGLLAQLQHQVAMLELELSQSKQAVASLQADLQAAKAQLRALPPPPVTELPNRQAHDADRGTAGNTHITTQQRSASPQRATSGTQHQYQQLLSCPPPHTHPDYPAWLRPTSPPSPGRRTPFWSPDRLSPSRAAARDPHVTRSPARVDDRPPWVGVMQRSSPPASPSHPISAPASPTHSRPQQHNDTCEARHHSRDVSAPAHRRPRSPATQQRATPALFNPQPSPGLHPTAVRAAGRSGHTMPGGSYAAVAEAAAAAAGQRPGRSPSRLIYSQVQKLIPQPTTTNNNTSNSGPAAAVASSPTRACAQAGPQQWSRPHDPQGSVSGAVAQQRPVRQDQQARGSGTPAAQGLDVARVVQLLGALAGEQDARRVPDQRPRRTETFELQLLVEAVLAGREWGSMSGAEEASQPQVAVTAQAAPPSPPLPQQQQQSDGDGQGGDLGSQAEFEMTLNPGDLSQQPANTTTSTVCQRRSKVGVTSRLGDEQQQCTRCGLWVQGGSSVAQAECCRFHPALLSDPGPLRYTPEYYACRHAGHTQDTPGCYVRPQHFFGCGAATKSPHTKVAHAASRPTGKQQVAIQGKASSGRKSAARSTSPLPGASPRPRTKLPNAPVAR